MLNEFLKVAHRHDVEVQEKKELNALLNRLPLEDLYKIAMGQKLAHDSVTQADGTGWLDQFKGTPLLPQAVEVEQEEIQLEAQIAQRYAMGEELHREKDQLNIKKRLLEVELAKGSGGGAEDLLGGDNPAKMPPAPPQAQGDGGVSSPEVPKQAAARFAKAASALKQANGQIATPPTLGAGTQQAAQTAGAAPTPTMAQPGALSNNMKMAEAMGRALARAEMAKQAEGGLASLAGRAGQAFGAVKDFARLNPGAAIGGGMGAAAGLAHGLHKDEHGNRHLLRGAAEGAVGGLAGAAAGHAVQTGAPLYQAGREAGLGRMEALQGAATQVKDRMGADMRNAYSQIRPDKQLFAPAAAKAMSVPQAG